MKEFATLNLGGDSVDVETTQDQQPKQTHRISLRATGLCEYMYGQLKREAAFNNSQFKECTAEDVMQAVRSLCYQLNDERIAENQLALSAVELENTIAPFTYELPQTLQLLCRWTVLVRVGVRRVMNELRGLVAYVPMPAHGHVKLAWPAQDLGRTHHMVLHVQGDKLLCRGYTMAVQPDGDWLLGGADGNRWSKDLWLAPGLQNVNVLVNARSRKFGNHGSEESQNEQQRVCSRLRDSINNKRETEGIDVNNYSVAKGARADLENVPMMVTALSCVRALLAYTASVHEDRALDAIVNRRGYSKIELIENPDLAGQEAEAFTAHIARRDSLNSQYRACGSLVLPLGYTIYALQGIPASIPAERQTAITGVTGIAVSAEYLASRLDRDELRRHCSALTDVEDLTPLIEACGVLAMNGSKLASYNVVDDNGCEYMDYSLVNGTSGRLPLGEFMRNVTVCFLPIVVNFRRKRIVSADLQGERRGVRFAMSSEEVKFKWPHAQGLEQKPGCTDTQS